MPTGSKRPKLKELAERISKHLKRFENDPEINKINAYSLHPYYHAWATVSGNRVFVQYISYQGQRSLTRDEAERYLAWLDAGNVGEHWEALRK